MAHSQLLVFLLMLLTAIATAIMITPESKHHPWHIYTKRNITLKEKSGLIGAAPSRNFTCIRGEICSVFLKSHLDVSFLSNLTIVATDGKEVIGFVEVQNCFFQAIPMKLGTHHLKWNFRVSTGEIIQIPFQVEVHPGTPPNHMFHIHMVEPTADQFHQKASLLLKFVEHLADGVHENPHRLTVHAVVFKRNITRISLFYNDVKNCNYTDVKRMLVGMTGNFERKKPTKELTEAMTNLFNIHSIRLVFMKCYVFNPFLIHTPTPTPNTTVITSTSTIASRILDDIETSKLIGLLLIIIVVVLIIIVVAASVLIGWWLHKSCQKRRSSSQQTNSRNLIRDDFWLNSIEMDG